MAMPDRWSDAAFREAVATWGPQWGEDLAARTYSARLIGADPALVLHGGGNTSVKSEVRDLLGETLPVLFVKGSGSDLARVESSARWWRSTSGVFVTLQAGGPHLGRQGLGGSVVVVSSKNVFAPGEEFGAYSASKAGAHQLGRVAALELARDGIRVNMVLPDAVFGDGDLPSRLWQEVGPERARARGIEPAALAEHYRQRNLLRARITATHVGRAVVFFAADETPTTGAALPIDGGLPGAFPR